MRLESTLTRRQVLERLRHGTREMQRKAPTVGELESRPTRDGFVLAWAPGPHKPRGLCLTAAVTETAGGCIIQGKFGPDPHTVHILRPVGALVWVAALAAALTSPDPAKTLCLAVGGLGVATALAWLAAHQLPRLLCPAAEQKVLEFVRHNFLK